MKTVLVGEVRTADFVFEAMVQAGQLPSLVVTTDVANRPAASSMASAYYAQIGSEAKKRGIPVRVVSDLAECVGELNAVAPDYIFIVGWPYLVREPVLSIAPCIGMHPTPLPYRRGGAPLNWTLLDGERTGAVSLLRLRAGVDDGEILAQRTFGIGDDDYVGDLLERAYRITGELVGASLPALANGSAKWIPQDESHATYARRRRPEDGRIRWDESAIRIRNLVRATSRPFPGAFTEVEGTRLIVWRAELAYGVRAPLKAEPGTVLSVDEQGGLISTLDNALRITELSIGEGEPRTGSALAEALGGSVGRRCT